MSKSKKIFALIAALLLVATFALGGNAQAAAPPPPPVPAVTTAAPKPAPTKPLATVVRSVAPGSEKLPLLDLKVNQSRFDALIKGALKPGQPVSRYPVVINFSVNGITNAIPLSTKGMPTPDCGCNSPDEVVMVQNPSDKPPGKTAEERAAWQLARAMQRVAACLGNTTALNPRDKLPLWISTNSLLPTTDGMGGTGCVKLAYVLNALVPSSVVDNDPDKDGLIGLADKCPNEAGPSENKGCPVKTVAVEPAPTPTAVTVPVAAPAETPKTASIAAKKNSLYIPVGLYTGSLLSGSSLRNAHGGVDVGVSLQTLLTLEQLKGWSLALTLDLGQNTSFLNRGTVASNFPFMASFGGLYNLGQRVQIGLEGWFGLVYTNLPDQASYYAHLCGGPGARVQTSLGAVQLFVAAGIGGCRSAQPGYTPGEKGQPSAELGGQVHGGLQVRIPAMRW